MSDDRKRSLGPAAALISKSRNGEGEAPSHKARRRLGGAAFLLTLILVFLFYASPSRPIEGLAREGQLAEPSFDRGPLPLAGEWELLEDSQGSGSLPRYAVLPQKWASPYGYARYRLRLSGLDPARSYGLRTSSLDSSYRLLADGRLLRSGGRVGRSAAETRPAYNSGVSLLPPGRTELELSLEVANFVHLRGGPYLPIHFGYAEDIERYDAWSLGSDTVIIALLILIACFGAMSAGFRRNLSSLYYSLLCLGGALSFFLVSPEFPAFRLMPNLDWSLYVRLSFLIGYGNALWFLLTATSLFGGLSKRSALLLAAPTLILSLLCFLLPLRVLVGANWLFVLNTLTLVALSIVLFGRAVLKSYPYARILSLGFALLLGGSASFVSFSIGRLSGGGFFVLSFLYPILESRGISHLGLDLASYVLSLIGLNAFSLIFFIEAPKLGKPSPALAREEGREAAVARMEGLGLSPREIEVVLLALRGKRNKEIAESLFVSENTIKTHLARIFAKLKIKARSELFAYFSRA